MKKQHQTNLNNCRQNLLRLLITFLIGAGVSFAQQTDICGCANHPNSLGDFDSADESTYPPGTTRTNTNITIPLPEDGVLIFDSFTVNGIPGSAISAIVRFERNSRNTPVTLLVEGDVFIAGNNTINLDGDRGQAGSATMNGIGSLGGPGGFRGGDAAHQGLNFVNDGGAGLGPGGGAGGTANPVTDGAPGSFVGVPELMPLVGGCGGGGGSSHSDITATGCNDGVPGGGGGGAGGGGAILIAANGTVTIDGIITANGGIGGQRQACGTYGGGGSGGAIRLIANLITSSSPTASRITATGARQANGINQASDGFIRLEARTNTLAGNQTNPPAIRASVPGPIVNPLAPSVSVVAVGGQAVPANPQGWDGFIDIPDLVTGLTSIDIQTQGVPGGTNVEVTAKPQVGGNPIIENVTLSNCDGMGVCDESVSVDLQPGTYFIEARATFQTM